MSIEFSRILIAELAEKGYLNEGKTWKTGHKSAFMIDCYILYSNLYRVHNGFTQSNN